MFKKLIFAITAIFLIVALAELSARTLNHAPQGRHKKYMVFSSDKLFLIENGLIPKNHFLFKRDPYLFWALKYAPEDKLHAVNSQGFRGKTIALEKPAATYRIFCIGDSCTFGLGVEYFESYPFLLEKMLNSDSGAMRYEVINAGVPGYSSLQGLRHLQKDILKYKPDLVIASFGWNDTLEALFFTDKEQRAPGKILLKIDSMLRASYAYLILEDNIAKLSLRHELNRRKSGSPRPDNMLLRVPADDFADNLNKMCEFGKTHNFELIFLNQPSINGRHRYDYLTRNFCNQNHVPFLDLKAAFNSSKFTAHGLFMDGNHTTATGNRVIAQTIYDFIKTTFTAGLSRAESDKRG